MHEQEFKYDVFLSHASEDNEWCRMLAERLRREGVRVWFDLWKIRFGDHLLVKLNEGLEQSRQTIVVWTHSYFRDNKRWTLLEAFSQQFSDPLASQRSVIPLLRETSKIPPTLSNLIYIDFREGADFEVQFRQLMESLILPKSELRYRLRSVSSKTYMEDRIREVHDLSVDSKQRSLLAPSTVSEPTSPESGNDNYEKVARYYFTVYLHLCRRLGTLPDKDIVELMESDSQNLAIDNADRSMPASASQLYTRLEGSRILRLGVSQMFRIADLLTRPESVKAKKLYEAITNIGKMRRMLNQRKAKGIQVGTLGKLRPVVLSTEEFDQFWKPGLPDPRLPGSSPLCFVPYELSLSEHLHGLRSELDSILDSALLTDSDNCQNVQISGRLRIYPPGIGVVSLGITLEFRKAVHVEAAAQIAHNIEDLLFVDAVGLRRPYHRLVLEIIDQVIEHLFKKEGFPFAERRWLPPLTTYSLRDDRGLIPADNTVKLAYLMSLAPGNQEDLQYLIERIQRALRSRNWTREGIIAVAGQSVALFFISGLIAQGSKRRREELQGWLTETHELVSAAAYAQQAFAEQTEKIFAERLLDESWLTEENQKFEYLSSLLETMRLVMQAIASIKSHLKHQGTGILMSFSTDIWTYSHPVDKQRLQQSLEYIGDWLTASQSSRPDERIARLARFVKDILGISSPFATHAESIGRPSSPLQEELEIQILSELQVIEEILSQAGSEGDGEVRARFHVVEELRQQLGL